MMWSRKVLAAAGFITTWTFVTYYFLLRNNPVFVPKKEGYLEKLEYLESEAHQEYFANDVMIQNFIESLRNKIDLTVSSDPAAANRFATLTGNIERIAMRELGINKSLSTTAPTTITKIITRFNNQPVIPVLVFACNRVSISKCLDNLVLYRPNIEQFPIIVSQDCADEATKKVILSYKDELTLIEQPDQSHISVQQKERKFEGYYKIARHYGWALNTTFQKGYEFVIIVEDDLNIAPDFYEYFLATYRLLNSDPTLWCVSAWNDNGKIGLIDTSRSDLLYRTDFFPGLGWMLTRELWWELSVKWPASFWDDWIRHPQQRKNRACIRPEISRTRTFGKVGVSNGLFFDKYLKHIKLSEEFVHFSKLNLSYLLKDNYDKTIVQSIYNYPIVTFEDLRRNLIHIDGPVRIQYNTKDQYRMTAKMLGLMDDFKSGVPRTGYYGIVSFYYNKRRVHLTPSKSWKGYELT